MEAPKSQAESRGTRILLAEDDPTNQYVFKAILGTAGYQVEIVENGLLALQRAREARPDLILLDMMMPVMDGYEAASRLVADPLFDGIPILALTAKAMKGDMEKTLDAGCDDFMSKPIGRAALLEKIDQWLKRPEEEWMPRRQARRTPGVLEA